ncbi:protein of unknown function DUF1501 [Isosphaera pallida ATCC 43644]|uniref:DUF1501 domain-containing protein n=1 Tax=Isosphaera pallida (strain ATCC 43644 / DSM 9630 / IS1B) TaxID=575540 RepID=E8R1S8_ISOPI|nr:DUF1501 domain-containing protein [Isosphaera pallida]ADV61350.1 protein of unknown function DUF1501 [Isosphaera pallida ATCC 43644]
MQPPSNWTPTRGSHRHPIGVARREFLQIGFSGLLGVGMGSWSLAHAAAATGGTTAPSRLSRARSVVIVFFTGGVSHHDTFDPKPDAPDGIRGDFNPIATKVPGLFISEHLPRLASHADKLAIVRSLSHGHSNHLNATHWILTGHPQPGAFFDKIASRDDYPHPAALVARVRPPADGLPSGVLLPTFLMQGPLIWPGQHAGFLGPKYDPWIIKDDPNRNEFQVKGLTLPDGFSVERLRARRALFEQLHTLRDQIERDADPLDPARALAYSTLTSDRLANAFQLDRERAEVRDRYGRHMFGQSLLLARRLIEAGVPIVQVNLGEVQTWDSHGDIFRRLKNDLLPPTDQGLSALLDDLDARGLLDETLVVMVGEFGRTPRLGLSAGATIPGRDHWPGVFSAVFAGGGVQGGQVVGKSDPIGAYPGSRPYAPADVAATVYDALAIPPHIEVRDRLNRPLHLITGKPIEALYRGFEA